MVVIGVVPFYLLFLRYGYGNGYDINELREQLVDGNLTLTETGFENNYFVSLEPKGRLHYIFAIGGFLDPLPTNSIHDYEFESIEERNRDEVKNIPDFSQSKCFGDIVGEGGNVFIEPENAVVLGLELIRPEGSPKNLEMLLGYITKPEEREKMSA